MRSALSGSNAASSPQVVPPPVLILCADEGVAEELIRELAGRHYQPLVGRPGWSWRASLEWARPVAAVVDRQHPAARSDGFLAVSDDLEVGLVMFGGPVDVAPGTARSGRGAAVAAVPTVDVQLIGGAVDATVRRRSA
jgi:hypothetical protein